MVQGVGGEARALRGTREEVGSWGSGLKLSIDQIARACRVTSFIRNCNPP